MTLAKDIASHLLKIQAVYLKPEEPFTWASGIKSPIYTDNRVTISRSRSDCRNSDSRDSTRSYHR